MGDIDFVKRSAGIFYYYIIVNGVEEKMRVVLSRRTDIDNLILHRVCQCSAGIIKPSENVFGCLARKTKEELGKEFAGTVNVRESDPIHSERYEYKDVGEVIVKVDASYSVMEITARQAQLIKLSEEHEGIIFVGPEDIGEIKTTKQGFDPEKNIVMFPDQLRALKKVFQR